MHTQKRRKIQGTVVSNKMDRTVTVQVDTQVTHPILRKTIRRRNKFMAHDQNNQCSIGDKVLISETRPMSKRKRWAVVEIVEKAS